MSEQLHEAASRDQAEDGKFPSHRTRRDFIKGSAAVTSGLVLSAHYSKPSVSTLGLRTTLDPSSVLSDGGQGKGKAKGKTKGKAKGKAKGHKK